MTHLDRLQGLWRRSLIAWPDGRADTTTSVDWLQGPTFYVDLRQAPRPAIAAGCLRELTRADVERLARQEGFAGILREHADCFEWTRLIDYQPRALYSDRGTLVDHGGVMIEEGLEIAYTEHWHRAGGAPPPCAGLRMRDRASGIQAILVRSGDLFMIARDRARPLSDLPHLTDNVEAAASLEDAQDLVDCELSFGQVSPDGWIIARSSLPWRVGADLGPRRTDGGLLTEDRASDGTLLRRHWVVFETDGHIETLFAGHAPVGAHARHDREAHAHAS